MAVAVGQAVMVKAGTFTVSRAAELVALPKVFVKTARNRLPVSPPLEVKV